MNLLLICFLGIVSLIALNVDAIQNGYDAREDITTQFPYLSYIEFNVIRAGEETPITRRGAGALVDPTLVLTSAYLVEEVIGGIFGSLLVKVGPYDPTLDTTNTFPDLTNDSIIFHPQFEKITYTNRVALIRLPRAVTDVKVATLIEPGQIVARNECYVAGYGPLVPNGEQPNPAHIAPQPLLCKPGERKECIARNNARLAVTYNGTFELCNVAGEELCAGYFQSPVYIGPCSISPFGGDIGAPLQCNLDGNQGKKEDQVVVGFLQTDTCYYDNLVGLSPPDRAPNGYRSIIKYIKFIDDNRV